MVEFATLAGIDHVHDRPDDPVLFIKSDQVSPSRYHLDIEGGDIR